MVDAIDIEDKNKYIIMELVEGKTLSDVFKPVKKGKFDEITVFSLYPKMKFQPLFFCDVQKNSS